MAFKMKNTSMAKLAKEAGNNRVSPMKAKDKFKVKRKDRDFLTDKQKKVVDEKIIGQQKTDYDPGPGIKNDPYKDRDEGQKDYPGLAYDSGKDKFYDTSEDRSVNVKVKGRKPKKGEVGSYLSTPDRTNLQDIKKIKLKSGKGKYRLTTKIKYNKDGSIKKVSNRGGRFGLKKSKGVYVGVGKGRVRGQAAAEKVIETRADNNIRKNIKRKGGDV